MSETGCEAFRQNETLIHRTGTIIWDIRMVVYRARKVQEGKRLLVSSLIPPVRGPGKLIGTSDHVIL